jgi:hypothetical protein
MFRVILCLFVGREEVGGPRTLGGGIVGFTTGDEAETGYGEEHGEVTVHGDSF